MAGQSTYEAMMVLGGGRDNSGKLTEISIQRLDKGYELYKAGEAGKIFAMGGHLSTYNPNAIYFDQSGALLRWDYLVERGVSEEDIILVEDGKDTIGEAFASRAKARELGLSRVLLVTSDKHMERALWIFRRIYGENFEIEGIEVPCGNILIADEERKYLEIVREFFATFPLPIPDPNLETWYDEHKFLYESYREAHDRYHPPGGTESQAYMGVRKEAK